MERKSDTAFQKVTRLVSAEFPSLRIFTQNATRKLISGEKPVSVTTLNITRASSYWYPTMLTQEAGEISESKAAELLGTNIEEYRRIKWQAINAVLELIKNLPSPLISLADVIKNKPEFFDEY